MDSWMIDAILKHKDPALEGLARLLMRSCGWPEELINEEIIKRRLHTEEKS